jgi:hypothetical protein
MIERRHPGPRVEGVGDVVRREHTQVFRAQVIFVTDLDSVTEPFRERLEEWIDLGQEIGGGWKGLLIECAEFKVERTDLLAVEFEPGTETGTRLVVFHD